MRITIFSVLLLILSVHLAVAFYGRHKDKKIYVYDSSDWREITKATTMKRDPHELLDNLLNNGAGPLINSDKGSFHTDQYQLFSMFYHRILNDPRRTMDPAEATSFFVPYDFASDAAFYKSCPKSAGNCYDFRKCPLAPQVEDLLSRSPWYRRNGGHDHILIVGMNYAMDHYIGKPRCKSLLTGTCKNCTKFSIDDYSFMYGDDEGIKARGDYWYAVPFPSNFHWSPRVKVPYDWENNDRPLVVSYVGSSKSYYNPARRLRGSLIHYCELHGDLCLHQTYGANGTRSSFHVRSYHPLDLSLKSVFCFQPIGDLMTRKGLFDSLLQGCIPVVFDALTSSAMYVWHWEESFWKDVSIEYPFHPTAHRYFDPVLALQQLVQNNGSEIHRKQQLIRNRVFELQYSMEGRYEEWRRMNASNPCAPFISSHWPLYLNGEPMNDAYDIAMDKVLGWHSHEEAPFRNATVPECWGKAILDSTANRCVMKT